jgi:hypothetical protein
MMEGVARYQRIAIPLDLGALTLEAPALAHSARSLLLLR